MKIKNLKIIKAALEELISKTALTFDEYKKLHPKTKKSPKDPIFTQPEQSPQERVKQRKKVLVERATESYQPSRHSENPITFKQHEAALEEMIHKMSLS